MSLYVGGVLGGPETRTSPVLLALRKASQAAAKYEEEASSGGSVDLVFHIPGSIVRLDYSGLRTGRFSRKERMLMVQVAVPKEMVFAENPDGFVYSAMREAIHIAAPRFQKAKIAFSVEQHLALVDAIVKDCIGAGSVDSDDLSETGA